jgi:hypothetical protein
MSYLRAFPVLSLVIIAWNLMVFSSSMLQPDSLLGSWVAPSGTEVFFTFGDIFALIGLGGLLLGVFRVRRGRAWSSAGRLLAVLTFLAAALEFLLVPACGTSMFLLLTAMALVDGVASLIEPRLAAGA